MTESGVNNDRDLGVFVLGDESGDRLVQLGKARLGSALGRDVRSVDDDVLGHPFIESPATAANGAIRPHRASYSRLT